MKGLGTISCSNVNHPNSQCITLTYTIKDIGKFSDAKPLAKELNGVASEEGVVEVTVKDLGTKDEQTDMKWKAKDCTDEAGLHTIKKKLDIFLKKEGGQTTLDEHG